jgi:hypothetical protein
MQVVPTIQTVLVQIPVLLVWLVGVVLALVYWRRHPMVSTLVLTALGLLFITALFGASLNWWLPLIHARGVPAARFGLIIGIISIIRAMINATAFALLLAAIFGWRSVQAEPSRRVLEAPEM